MTQEKESRLGRPSKYTPEIADRILSELRLGASLKRICEAEDMPSEVSVRTWAVEDREGFSARYAQARQDGYQWLADEILAISDDSSNDEIVGRDGEIKCNAEFVARSRLRVDTRKWILAKMLPKVFGEKTVVAGDADAPVRIVAATTVDQAL